MRMVDLIAKKQAGEALLKAEIDYMITGFTNGAIPDYQMSAMAMAIYFQDMNDQERADLTMAMVHSGDVIDLSVIPGIKVDKHSTGGVGDTTSLILAPLVAALGVPVAKMSGRGLGHTGGTIDKLESFTGFHTELSDDRFVELIQQNHIALMGQTGNITPADKKLYSLRDVTATVQSIPLIASSIMCKKIAAGADAIVLDVKVGAGAFMKTLAEAEELATAMVKIGHLVGRQTIAVISDMDQPLGNAIGNVLEIKEAIDTLKGQGPEDLTELVLTLGSRMVLLAKKASSVQEAREMLQNELNNGQALAVFKKLITSQGGDATAIDHPEQLPTAKWVTEYQADKAGYISELVADEIGRAVMLLGAGRATKDSEIDLSVGLVLHKKIGDSVAIGESIATIHHNLEEIAETISILQNNIHISASKPQIPRLIYGIIEG